MRLRDIAHDPKLSEQIPTAVGSSATGMNNQPGVGSSATGMNNQPGVGSSATGTGMQTPMANQKVQNPRAPSINQTRGQTRIQIQKKIKTTEQQKRDLEKQIRDLEKQIRDLQSQLNNPQQGQTP